MALMGKAESRRHGHRAAVIARLLAVLVVSLGVLVLHVMTVENGGDRPAAASASTHSTVALAQWTSTSAASAAVEQTVSAVAANAAGHTGDHAWTSVLDCGLALLSAVALVLLVAALIRGLSWAPGSFRVVPPGRLRPPCWPQLRLSLGVSQV